MPGFHLHISGFVGLVLAGLLLGKIHAATALDPMIALFHKWQMKDAPEVVDRAAEHGHQRVQFCIALQAELKPDLSVKSIGLYRENRDLKIGGNRFYPFDLEIKRELQGYYTAAFRRAVERKLGISILLHLNAHGQVQEWRNNFDFDPLVRIEGSSYEESCLIPVIESLESAVPADWPIDISLQGEMGTTVFKHPDSWKSLLEHLRARRKLSNLRCGLSFNYQGVAGKAKPEEIHAESLTSLWKSCDFIGVSMYQSVSPMPRPEDFDLAVGLFAGEFAGLRCQLPANKPLHFVEVGLGGGGLSASDWKPRIPAGSLDDAARAPYLGSSNPNEADPWKNADLKAFRMLYHQALCGYLSSPRPRYAVKQAFLWSFGSWDPYGLEESRFADAGIMELISAHNRKSKAPGS